MKTSPKSNSERFAAAVKSEDEKEVLWFDESMMAPHLLDVESVTLTRKGLLRQIRAQQAAINELQARQLEAMARFTELAESRRGAPNELSLALSVSKRWAEQQIAFAQDLTTRFPETFEAMRQGELDSYRASKITDPASVLSDKQAREVDRIMAGRFQGKDPEKLRKSANRAVRQVDPDGYAARCEARRKDRNLKLSHQDEGMVTLTSDQPVETGVAIYKRCDTEARRRKIREPEKTMDQLRADVLADLCLRDECGVKVGPKADVVIYVDLLTLAGLNDTPAHIPGHGEVPAWLLDEIIFNSKSTWHRLVTDPDSGKPISGGHDTYRPSRPMARWLWFRDQECRSPNCHRPAHVSEIDHCLDWAKNGETKEENLAGFCPFDHHLKDEPRWCYEHDEHTGRITITTPTGDQYTSDVEPLHEPRPKPENDEPPF